MNPVNKSIANYDELFVRNEEKSIEILDKALQTDDLPSRVGHLVTGIYTVVTAPISLSLRISQITWDVFRLIRDLIVNNQRLQRFEYNIYRIFVLDPVYILTGTVTTIIQIASLILGIFSPQWGVKGWRASVSIELVTAQTFFEAKKECQIQDPPELFEITPTNATFYLGLAKAKQIADTFKTDIQNKDRKAQIQNILSSLLHQLSMEYPDYFNRKYPPAIMKKIFNLWVDDYSQKLTIEYIKERIQSLNTSEELQGIYKKIQHVFLISLLSSGLDWQSYNVMLAKTSQLRDNLEELFFDDILFGSVRT